MTRDDLQPDPDRSDAADAPTGVPAVPAEAPAAPAEVPEGTAPPVRSWEGTSETAAPVEGIRTPQPDDPE